MKLLKNFHWILIGMLTLCFPLSSIAQLSIYFSPALSYLKVQSTNESPSNCTANCISPDISRGLTPKFTLGASLSTRPIGGFYLGLEAIAEPFKPFLISSQGTQVRPSYIYGLNGLIGVNFDPYVISYLRLGVVKSSFKTWGILKKGYQIGGGLEWRLNQTWSLRGDYIRTRFRSFPPVPNTGEIVGSLTMDEYTFGFLIRFC